MKAENRRVTCNAVCLRMVLCDALDTSQRFLAKNVLPASYWLNVFIIRKSRGGLCKLDVKKVAVEGKTNANEARRHDSAIKLSSPQENFRVSFVKL